MRADCGGDPRRIARLGPYLLVDLDMVPIGDPLPQRMIDSHDGADGVDVDW